MDHGHAEVVVVGGGLAGYQVASTLREKGFAGRIVLLSNESDAPYHRPPLSKNYLGDKPPATLAIKGPDHYTGRQIELLTDTEAAAIDRASRTVFLKGGGTVTYGKLVLATGARARRLPGDGAVHYLRTEKDACALRQAAAAATSIAIVGGGFLGLEMAHVLNLAGKKVTVIEAAPRLLARTSSPAVSASILDFHRNAGIEILLGDPIEHIGPDGGVSSIALSSGRKIRADLVVASIGVLPNVELAAGAGLPVANGIVVDEFLSTIDSDVFAIGDCASFPSRHTPVALRLESVQNATDQARSVAATISGQQQAFAAIPTFWSDQGVRLQIVGLVGTADEFRLKGDPEAMQFSVYGFRHGQLVSVESVGQPAEFMAARKTLTSGQHPSPADLGLETA